MEFTAFGGLRFSTKEDYQVEKDLWRAYDIILTPVFKFIEIGNAKLYMLINNSKLKCVYGFGKILDGDIGDIYVLGSEDKDELMINLLQNDPEAFDLEYAKRVSEKTGRNFDDVLKNVREEREKGIINPSFFIDKRKNNLEWVAYNMEPIQICDNDDLTKILMERGVIYGDQNSHGAFILNYWERIDERFRNNQFIRDMYSGNRSRYGFVGSFPLCVIDDDGRKILFGILEFDDLKQIIKDPKKPIDNEKFYWAFNIIQRVLTSITLANLTHDINPRFIEHLANSVKVTIDTKDYVTAGHSDRVKELALRIGRKLVGTELGDKYGFDEQRLNDLGLAAMLHDIGKLGVPENILKSKSKLTPKEYMQICEHPKYGDDILSAIDPLRHLTPLIRGHHENYDGTGYPDHLKGEMIHLESRIIALADTYDAMTNERYYRNALPKEVALQEIKDWAGRQFDPKLVPILLEVV